MVSLFICLFFAHLLAGLVLARLQGRSFRQALSGMLGVDEKPGMMARAMERGRSLFLKAKAKAKGKSEVTKPVEETEEV